SFRRTGLMIGINLETANQVSELIQKCRERGVLLFWFLSVPNGFRISPPLVISKEEIKEGCAIILNALNELQ
ncbi:aminotransferase class III-fold pyridoxal phosphate-dependent enzyme, partial [Salibacteraceae bacterium]|nr:aminotransferase class III-fold pyridoxal phosphate-dependent enzyme [Salibacteraceae bacterium]